MTATWLHSTRQKWKVVVFLVGVFVGLAMLVLYITGFDEMKSRDVLLAGFMGSAIAAFAWLAASVRCPTCRTRVAWALMRRGDVSTWFVTLVSMSTCPRCDVTAGNTTCAAQGVDRAELLNDGLRLAMDWGEHWLQPIQERLAKMHPTLSQAELDECNAVCQAALNFGLDRERAYALAQALGKEVCLESFAFSIASAYPWMEAENLSRLFSQGMYYAWKDGLC